MILSFKTSLVVFFLIKIYSTLHSHQTIPHISFSWTLLYFSLFLFQFIPIFFIEKVMQKWKPCRKMMKFVFGNWEEKFCEVLIKAGT